jgi:hypothetical protein
MKAWVKVEARLKQDFTFYYFICIGQQKAGAIRIIDKKENGTCFDSFNRK